MTARHQAALDRRMSPRWRKLKAMRDLACERHERRSGIDRALRAETHRLLRVGVQRKRREAA